MKRIQFILLPMIIGLTAVTWLFNATDTAAQSDYLIIDWSYLVENGYYEDSGKLYYTDTGTIGVTTLSLADLQAAISTTETTILNTGVSIDFIGDSSYIAPGWWVTVVYTDTTSQVLYPDHISGVSGGMDRLYEFLSGDKAIQSISLYTDLTAYIPEYAYSSYAIVIPYENVGAEPPPAPTPTPIGIPTPDPVITYGWGGVVPTPIAYSTDTLTTTLSLTYFWDIDNYEYALSVSRTVWTLPWLPQAFAILSFFAAVMLGFTLLMRILKARSTAATQATVLAQQPFEERNEAEIRDEILRQELQGIRSDLRRQAATGLSRSFYRNVRGRGGGGRGLLS